MVSFVRLSPSSERGFAESTEPLEKTLQRKKGRKGRQKEEKDPKILQELKPQLLPLSTIFKTLV